MRGVVEAASWLSGGLVGFALVWAALEWRAEKKHEEEEKLRARLGLSPFGARGLRRVK